MKTFLKSFHLQNFKAMRDSKVINFMPLTVFTGNNGSGKNSLIEFLQTVRAFFIGNFQKTKKMARTEIFVAVYPTGERTGFWTIDKSDEIN